DRNVTGVQTCALPICEIQRLQMATQEGANVAVYAVRGNFDDAQTGVKRVFADKEIAARLAQRNICLSSANSINWGRLAPQIVYRSEERRVGKDCRSRE